MFSMPHADAVDRPTTDVLVEGRAALPNIFSIDVTPRGVPRADVLVEGRRGQVAVASPDSAQNKLDMSVTLPVFHVEMWPYVASAAVASESHAATAILMLPVGHDITIAQLGMLKDAARRRHAPPVNAVQAHVVVHAPAEVLVEGEAPDNISSICPLSTSPDVLVERRGAS